MIDLILCDEPESGTIMSTTVVKSVAAVIVFVSVAASLDCDRGKIGMFYFLPRFCSANFYLNHILTGKQTIHQNRNEC